MQEAIGQAQKAFEENEVPVGAVIVERTSCQIIARAHNKVEQGGNALLHAEMIAINIACAHLGSKNLSNCDIYVSLEPCSMCSGAISLARISRLFYAASDLKHGAVENGVRFFNSSCCFHRPEIYNGILSQLSVSIIKNFFSKIRKDSL